MKGVIDGEGEVGSTCDLHFDMLQVPGKELQYLKTREITLHNQVMGQLDLKMSDARRNMVKKLLTTLMTNRLKDEEADQEKLRRRDRSNALLAENVNSLVKEEGKLNSNLKQMRQGDHRSNNNSWSRGCNYNSDYKIPRKKVRLNR